MNAHLEYGRKQRWNGFEETGAGRRLANMDTVNTHYEVILKEG